MIGSLVLMVIGAAIAVGVMRLMSGQKEQISDHSSSVPTESAELAHYKKRILATSAYEQESTYKLLQVKIAHLVEQRMIKHDSVLHPDVARADIKAHFKNYFEKEHGIWRIRRDLDLRSVRDDVLLSLARISLRGTTYPDRGEIRENMFFANRAVQYLVEERQYWPAQFLRAMILKYGFHEHSIPMAVAAMTDFREIGSRYNECEQELADIGLFIEIENSKWKRFVYGGDPWRTHVELEERIKTYHPTNVNG